MASAITLGAIASATAPAATLMVVKQYKASGPLTRLLLMVVAIDDAVGLVLFSASFGIANALEQGRIDPISILLEPLVEIVLSLGLGALAGLLLNQLEIETLYATAAQCKYQSRLPQNLVQYAQGRQMTSVLNANGQIVDSGF